MALVGREMQLDALLVRLGFIFALRAHRRRVMDVLLAPLFEDRAMRLR